MIKCFFKGPSFFNEIILMIYFHYAVYIDFKILLNGIETVVVKRFLSPLQARRRSLWASLQGQT